MSIDKNSPPETIHCGFCGEDINWGYTACKSCGATVTYGIDATRGIWFFVGVIGYALLVFGACFLAVVALIATASAINTGAMFLDMLISLICAGAVGYGIVKAVVKLVDWLVKATGIDSLWRNKYIFSRSA